MLCCWWQLLSPWAWPKLKVEGKRNFAPTSAKNLPNYALKWSILDKIAQKYIFFEFSNDGIFGAVLLPLYIKTPWTNEMSTYTLLFVKKIISPPIISPCPGSFRRTVLHFWCSVLQMAHLPLNRDALEPFCALSNVQAQDIFEFRPLYRVDCRFRKLWRFRKNFTKFLYQNCTKIVFQNRFGWMYFYVWTLSRSQISGWMFKINISASWRLFLGYKSKKFDHWRVKMQ